MYLNREKRAALKIANQVRQDFGYPKRKKLSKGVRKNSKSCPIANTINEDLRAEVTASFIDVCGKDYLMPQAASDFVIRFDENIDHRELAYIK
jgi:hypothetical protein